MKRKLKPKPKAKPKMKKKRKKVKTKTTFDVKRILLRNRNIFLTGVINADSVHKTMEQLIALDLNNEDWITLYINSPGGSVAQTFALIDTIKGLRSKVRTFIIGNSLSAATLLGLFGNERIMTANATWMGHEMTIYSCDYLSKTKCTYKHFEKFEDMILNIYKTRTKLNDKDLETIKNGELWLTADECLAKGIVDKVVGK